MSWLEIVVMAWVCDRCDVEALSPDDGMPEGWTLMGDYETHWCAVCVGELR